MRLRAARAPPPAAPPPAPLTPHPPARRAGADAATSEALTDKILDTNPILEAFGNAKTTRNKNSSRFGRYVLVQFSADNEVVGAEIRTFLLERSRVTSTSAAKERSYHVLFQVLAGGGVAGLSVAGNWELDYAESQASKVRSRTRRGP